MQVCQSYYNRNSMPCSNMVSILISVFVVPFYTIDIGETQFTSFNSPVYIYFFNYCFIGFHLLKRTLQIFYWTVSTTNPFNWNKAANTMKKIPAAIHLSFTARLFSNYHKPWRDSREVDVFLISLSVNLLFMYTCFKSPWHVLRAITLDQFSSPNW